MKKIYVKIEGMTCAHCNNKITDTLKKIDNVKNIKFDGDIAEIEYAKKLNKNQIIDYITNIGYYTNIKMINDNKTLLKRTLSLGELLIISFLTIIIVIILNKLFGFNIFNIIPVIDSKATYMMLFLTGLFTSIHCISMCGAINLVAIKSNNIDYKKPILYNLGRLVSYTLIGGVVGLLGSVFQVNYYLQGIIIMIASIFLFLMGLNFMGIINFSFHFIKFKWFNKVKVQSSFVLGLFNGLMPCGPLQAMQLYALSTGSFILGALSMFVFCLGTIPLMLFVGIIANLLKRRAKNVLNKVSVVLILLLSFIMFNRGLLSMGIDISNVFKPNYNAYQKSEIIDNYQIIEIDLKYSGYKDIIVQKGVPVKMIINATFNSLTGCNNSIWINEFKINKDLTKGENIIEFTPNKTGTFTYTCWMGMLKNKIVVIDDLDYFNSD